MMPDGDAWAPPRLGNKGDLETVQRTWAYSDTPDAGPSDRTGFKRFRHRIRRAGHRMSRPFRTLGREMEGLAQVQKEITRSLSDTHKYPELLMDAELRRDNKLGCEETAYIKARKAHILGTRALQRFLNLPLDLDIHPDDIPICAAGGSGGGYRSTFGFLALLEIMQEEADGLWDLLFYTSGVSGSCWSIAALYTVGEMSAKRTLEHFGATSSHHPVSPKGIHRVARSPNGVLHQVGPIVQKKRLGAVKANWMDLYSTLTSTHVLLPAASPGNEHPAIDESHLRWSSIIGARRLDMGHQPLPLFTACRHERPWQTHTPSEDADGVTQAILSDPNARDRRKPWWQWFELSPFEIGSDELEGWIPTWSFGRVFRKGKSTKESRRPEQSFSLLLGMSTSAIAGPWSSWLESLTGGLEQHKIGRGIEKATSKWAHQHPREAIHLVNKHPVHSMNEANPFYQADREPGRGEGLEHETALSLIDAGIANNLPTYTFFRPHREVDVAILGDYSSDVQSEDALQRVIDGGKEKGLEVVPRQHLDPLPTIPGRISDHANKKPLSDDISTDEIEKRYSDRYVQLLDARPTGREQMAKWEQKKSQGLLAKWEERDFKMKDGFILNHRHVPLASKPSILVYLPLLPNKVRPDFDPATAPYSTSLNVVWTKEQIDTLREVAKADHRAALDTLRCAVKEAYERKRDARLKREADGPPKEQATC